MTQSNKLKIAVGLSGGVDSAVTALLLKQQGHEVLGIFMQNWETDNDDPYCTAEQDLTDARAVAKQINIPFHVVNFAKEYWHNVFHYCLDEFSAGRTPNPDIWCNKEIKFKVFLQHALALGVDYLATGHYARIKKIENQFQLLKGLDSHKDQSYFLHALGQHELQHSLFPLGEYTKPQVRKIAKENNFLNSAKKDSTGICFIGERKFKEFLQEFLLAKPGDMQTPDGEVIGRHDGLMYYTIGQRQGLNIGGRKAHNEKPWYVVDKVINQNVLIVAQGADHPLLYKDELSCEQLTWIANEAPEFPLACTAKIRYRQADQACQVIQLNKTQCHVSFSEPQRAVTPGQSVVFYQNEVCLGGGVICIAPSA